MSKHGNLFLVINMGCEMLYIIDQRLTAQKVPTYKGIQVLTDITDVLFDETLLNELSNSKQLGSPEYIKTLLEDIASVSVMRLDPFSMTKLWELMTMVVKWQITLTEPQNLIILTDRHLRGAMRMVKNQHSCHKIEKAMKMFKEFNETFSIEDLTIIRNAILFWLGDFRTRVSILLRLDLQRNDGSFVYYKNSNENKYIKYLGCNIYSNELDETVEQMCDNNSDELDHDVPELSFVLDILEKREVDNKKTKFSLFQENRNTENMLNATEGNQISYVQSKSPKCLVQNDSLTRSFDGNISSTSSIHDDLLTLISETSL